MNRVQETKDSKEYWLGILEMAQLKKRDGN
jgi:hypothetical protein